MPLLRQTDKRSCQAECKLISTASCAGKGIIIEFELYQSAQKEVDEAINELERVGLSREQNKVVDRAISAANASGAAYAAIAYKQGIISV